MALSRRKMSLRRVAVVSAALVAFSGSWPSMSAAQPSTHVVYVSASAKSGGPVADLQPSDIELKVNGKKQEVLSVRPATAPLRIALVDSDGGTGAFQLAIARFMQRLLGHAEFALTSVIRQPERIVDYAADAPTLSAGVSRLGARGRDRGAQLMEAIVDAVKDVRVEGKSPVIVVMRIGGENASELSGKDVREQLEKSGAILYVMSTLGAQRPVPSQIRGSDAVSVQQGQLHDAEYADAANNLAQVLGDGSKDSGGRNEQIISTTLVPMLESVADELLHQYAVTYSAEGAKPGDKLSVSSKRKDVSLHAPARLP
jgi:hypothetical protein